MAGFGTTKAWTMRRDNGIEKRSCKSRDPVENSETPKAFVGW